MMRRDVARLNMWAGYRFGMSAPRVEGPPPLNAPRTMNSTKAYKYLDPVNDAFPVAIRGSNVRPDVPADQWVDQTFAINTTTPMRHELTPWAADAPEGAFRFRSFDDFDTQGRREVTELRRFERDGAAGPPHRESLLARMAAPASRVTASPATIMDRAIKQEVRGVAHRAPLEVQRDAGRREPTVRSQGRPQAAFPYVWNTTDWYEYEVAKVRLKRFQCENDRGGHEVTYKLILGMDWDHHGKSLVEDVCSFVRDVGRETLCEKLASIRNILQSFGSQGQHGVDAELRRAFNLADDTAYDDEEISQFVRRELVALEAQCVRIVAMCNSASPTSADDFPAGATWPYVEHLEPWKRMVEFWGEKADATLTKSEMSSRKYEFRKFFRTIVIKMPFRSAEFEKRLYDIRHWLHRRMSVEFHTIHMKNVLHDAAHFPVEHDASEPQTHEDHALLSFALDWQQAPSDFAATATVQVDTDVNSVAMTLGTTVSDLRAANPGLAELHLPAGTTVVVPRTATRRRDATGRGDAAVIERTPSMASWQQVADATGLTVEELQAANGQALASYDNAADAFDPSTTKLTLPHTASTDDTQFAGTELTFESDSFETVAERLGCTAESLRKANPSVEDPAKVQRVNVPPEATTPRRQVHPLRRSRAEIAELFPQMVGEQHVRALPDELPREPDNAANFPGEYSDSIGNVPRQPRYVPGADDWLEHTAAFLDPQLSLRSSATPEFNQNKTWPFVPIPGTEQQTPFEEDQTWLLGNLPVQRRQVIKPDQHLQDTPFSNHEQFAHSLDRSAP